MKKIFLAHYRNVELTAKSKLKEFKRIKDCDELFEEMTFCVFAANSSAEMGLLAVELLKDTMKYGTLDDFQTKVHKKVRFYNKRSEYLFYNREKIKASNMNLKDIITQGTPHEKRLFIRENFKGFGLKEASHFLRNTGTKGLCIIDKHVLSVMRDLNVIAFDDIPKRDEDYYRIERKILQFAEDNNLDVDVLDLAAWSFKTGKIIK